MSGVDTSQHYPCAIGGIVSPSRGRIVVFKKMCTWCAYNN